MIQVAKGAPIVGSRRASLPEMSSSSSMKSNSSFTKLSVSERIEKNRNKVTADTKVTGKYFIFLKIMKKISRVSIFNLVVSRYFKNDSPVLNFSKSIKGLFLIFGPASTIKTIQILILLIKFFYTYFCERSAHLRHSLEELSFCKNLSIAILTMKISIFFSKKNF